MKAKQFIHHYLYDTIVATVFLLLTIKYVYAWTGLNSFSPVAACSLVVLAALVSQLLYWFVIRRYYIRTILWCYKQFDRTVIRHIEQRGVNRWLKQHKKSLERENVYSGLSEKQRAKLLEFASEIFKAKELREQEIKQEAAIKLSRVMAYVKTTLLKLNFSAEEIFKICNHVELFVTTRSVIHSPASIARKDDVSIAELKNFVANIADQYGIDNTTAAQFFAEVFKEWCVWTDSQGNVQRTEVSTIAKTLRNSSKKARVQLTGEI